MLTHYTQSTKTEVYVEGALLLFANSAAGKPYNRKVILGAHAKSVYSMSTWDGFVFNTIESIRLHEYYWLAN